MHSDTGASAAPSHDTGSHFADTSFHHHDAGQYHHHGHHDPEHGHHKHQHHDDDPIYHDPLNPHYGYPAHQQPFYGTVQQQRQPGFRDGRARVEDTRDVSPVVEGFQILLLVAILAVLVFLVFATLLHESFGG